MGVFDYVCCVHCDQREEDHLDGGICPVPCTFKAPAAVKERNETGNITCPFCGDADFDPLGLKLHLHRGWCGTFNKINTSGRL